MKDQCTPPSTITSFSALLSSTEVLLNRNDSPQACRASLIEPAKTYCQNFTSWTHVMALMCGNLNLSAQIVQKKFNNQPNASRIILRIETMYENLNGVNMQYLTAITDINEGRSVESFPQPDPIPSFPTPNEDTIEQTLTEAWHIQKPGLEKHINGLEPNSPWRQVLQGIIYTSDQEMMNIQELFRELEN